MVGDNEKVRVNVKLSKVNTRNLGEGGPDPPRYRSTRRDVPLSELAEHIELRKVQRLGASSLIVTLPKKWVNLVGIKPGDSVLVKVRKDHIKIIPDKLAKKEGKIVVRVGKDFPQDISHIVINCLYTLGVDEASIVLEDVEDKENLILNIKSVSQDLVGVDVIEDERGNLLLSVFIDYSKLQVETVMKNFSNIVSLLFYNIENILKTGTINKRNIDIIKRDLIRYQHLLLRLLRKKQADDSNMCVVEVGTYLGLIIDPVLSLASVLVSLPRDRVKGRASNNVLELLEQIRGLVADTLDAVVNSDPRRVAELRNRANALQKRLMDALTSGRASRVDDIVLSFLLSSVRTLKIYMNILACRFISERYLSGRAV